MWKYSWFRRNWQVFPECHFAAEEIRENTATTPNKFISAFLQQSPRQLRCDQGPSFIACCVQVQQIPWGYNSPCWPWCYKCLNTAQVRKTSKRKISDALFHDFYVSFLNEKSEKIVHFFLHTENKFTDWRHEIECGWKQEEGCGCSLRDHGEKLPSWSANGFIVTVTSHLCKTSYTFESTANCFQMFVDKKPSEIYRTQKTIPVFVCYSSWKQLSSLLRQQSSRICQVLGVSSKISLFTLFIKCQTYIAIALFRLLTVAAVAFSSNCILTGTMFWNLWRWDFLTFTLKSQDTKISNYAVIFCVGEFFVAAIQIQIKIALSRTIWTSPCHFRRYQWNARPAFLSQKEDRKKRFSLRREKIQDPARGPTRPNLQENSLLQIV